MTSILALLIFGISVSRLYTPFCEPTRRRVMMIEHSPRALVVSCAAVHGEAGWVERRGGERRGRSGGSGGGGRGEAEALTGLTLSLMSCHGLICGEPSLSCPQRTETTD